MIMGKLKAALKQYGGHGFHALQRKFKIMDDDGSGALSLSEFKKGLTELQLGLADVDVRMLFEYFDTRHAGSIGFEDVRGVDWSGGVAWLVQSSIRPPPPSLSFS